MNGIDRRELVHQYHTVRFLATLITSLKAGNKRAHPMPPPPIHADCHKLVKLYAYPVRKRIRRLTPHSSLGDLTPEEFAAAHEKARNLTQGVG
jgi:hypothetical protein